MKPVAPIVKLFDGNRMSVQASAYHYCTPRNDEGPYTHYEVGFPTFVDHDLLEYAEEPDKPMKTVYAYVPVELIDKIITKHGGRV